MLTVGPGGAQFTTVQAAVDAAPADGAEIRLQPGIYREVVHVEKSGIHLRGGGRDPGSTVVVFGNSAATTCGTGCSATMFVTGDDFIATDLTVQNDYSKVNPTPSQAVALSIRGDRAVLRRVRLLGAQDTLYAASKRCTNVVCSPARQLFADCYIEGHVDFIFGDAKAYFESCEIHSIGHPAGGYVTAQSRLTAGQESGYVFDRCRLTADPGAGPVFLGRPWRDFATVIFLRSEMGSHIQPEGWVAWKGALTDRLNTATYAEFRSTGPGGDPSMRERRSRQLSAAEAQQYGMQPFLAGTDGWDPTRVQ